jgi:N-6 DNA Methylase
LSSTKALVIKRIQAGHESKSNQDHIAQIKSRFPFMVNIQGYDQSQIVGVGIDGRRIFYVQKKSFGWLVTDPVALDVDGCERFLNTLINKALSQKTFQSESLNRDFGPSGPHAVNTVNQLICAFSNSSNIKKDLLFRQWKLLFSEIFGDGIERQKSIQALYDCFQIPDSEDVYISVFSVQTYFAVVMKLLASEIVCTTSGILRAVLTIANSSNSFELSRSVDALESGGYTRGMAIENFLEGDLFAWYLCIEDEFSVLGCIRELCKTLQDYDISTIDKQIEKFDIIRSLYEDLMPRELRHDLGEYYTPYWLAEYTLDKIEYNGDSTLKILDPACGSGTFIVAIISRIRGYYTKYAKDEGLSPKQLMANIQANVAGIDLNPLAVLAARTNFLLSVSDLIRFTDSLFIPVYQADSIVTASDHSSLWSGDTTKEVRITSTVGDFIFPKSISRNPSSVSSYLSTLNLYVENAVDECDFLDKVFTIDPDGKLNRDVHLRLYRQFVQLHSEGRNGIWTRVIANSFAPIFLNGFDLVVGNPPWIFWNSLQGVYRERLREIMTSEYHIMSPKKSTFSKLGQSGKDISMLFVYASLDKFLAQDGRLGFVITKSIFFSAAGSEFRNFTLPNGEEFWLQSISDWETVKPFTGAANKTVVMVAKKCNPLDKLRRFEYLVYDPICSFDRDSSSLDEVKQACSQTTKQGRIVISKQGRNIQVSDEGEYICMQHSNARRFTDAFTSRLGIKSDLESAFRILIDEALPDGMLVVRNNSRRAKKAIPENRGKIERTYVSAYVGGSGISKWGCKPEGLWIIPHTATSGIDPITPSEFLSTAPKSLQYLSFYKDHLVARPLYKRWGAATGRYYAVFNIGTYTFSPFKLCWARSSRKFQCCVLSDHNDLQLGNIRLDPNNKVSFIAFDDYKLGHFYCGLLNSKFCSALIESSTSGEFHQESLNAIPFVEFDSQSDIHNRISTLSIELHKAVASSGSADIALESELERLVVNLYDSAR